VTSLSTTLTGKWGTGKASWLASVAIFASTLSVVFALPASAVDLVPLHTHEPIYQNPFDTAAGGASLTRATQDGALYANPSLSALGRGFFRWFFTRMAFHLGKDTVDLGWKTYQSGLENIDASEMLNKALTTPYFLGMDFTLGTLTRYGGVGVYSSLRADIAGRQFGSMGMPEIRLRALGYTGLASSAAVDFGDYFSLGVTYRYQATGEANQTVSLLDVAANSSSALSDMQKNLEYGFGNAVDIGGTFQLRSRHVDLRVAGTVNDVGTTSFTGNVTPWKQTYSAGVGITFHSRASAMHCAMDRRDLTAEYGEHWTRRTYAGCKLLFAQRMGVAYGLYQGWPSYGFVLSALFIRLEGGMYTKEMGSQAGTDPRRVYFVALGGEV
jgi:hypothetical protein